MVLITPRLVRPLNPDEVPPLPVDMRPFIPKGGGVGPQLQGGGGADGRASGRRHEQKPTVKPGGEEQVTRVAVFVTIVGSRIPHLEDSGARVRTRRPIPTWALGLRRSWLALGREARISSSSTCGVRAMCRRRSRCSSVVIRPRVS